MSPKSGYIHEATGSLPNLTAFFNAGKATGSLPNFTAFFNAGTFAVDTFFDIEPQKRSRFTKLGAQTQHRVIQRFLPPSASKQSGITCARNKGVFFNNIGQALSGSTAISLEYPQ